MCIRFRRYSLAVLGGDKTPRKKSRICSVPGGPTASQFFIRVSGEKRSISASIRFSSCCMTAA